MVSVFKTACNGDICFFENVWKIGQNHFKMEKFELFANFLIQSNVTFLFII